MVFCLSVVPPTLISSNDSSPAAGRVAEAMRLFPLVMLQEDERVKAAFAAWRARMIDGEAALEVVVASDAAL